MERDQKERQRDSEEVARHLSHLPLLGVLAQHMEELVKLAKTRTVKTNTVPSVSLGADIPFTFDDAVCIYVDNTNNGAAAVLQMDNIPLYFTVAANSGRFFPCAGCKQFRVTSSGATGTVNVFYQNQPMPYN